MPIEVMKVVVVGIVAFTFGTSFVQGRQVMEITNLNNRISALEKELDKAKNDSQKAQAKLTKQNQKVEDFYKQWQANK